MNKIPTKKIIASLLISSVIALPLRSSAQWVVSDPGNTGVSTWNAISGALTQVDQFFGHLKTFGLDGLAYKLAQLASQKLVSSVLNAVNGGASQNKPPNYISNYAGYFNSLSGKTTTNYYGQLKTSNNPFAKGIAVGIANNSAGQTLSGVDSFNLNRILTNGTAWQTAGGNLSSAGIQGWDFYTALAYPQNNPLGSNLLAQQQLNQNIANANNIAKIQLTSTGYKPQTLANTGQGIFASIGAGFGVNTNSLISASKAQVTANKLAAATNAEHGQNNGTTVTYSDGSYIKNGTYYNSLGGTIGSVTNTGNIYNDNMVLVGNSAGGSDGLPSGIADYNVAHNGGDSIGNPTGGRTGGDISGNSCSIDCVNLGANGAETIDSVPVDATTVALNDALSAANASGDPAAMAAANAAIDANDAAANMTGASDLLGPVAPVNPTIAPEATTEDYSSSDNVGADVATPSATVANTTNNAVGETQKRYQNANQFFELVAATLTNLVTGLLNKGISSLGSDAGHKSQYQYGSPASAAAAANGSNWIVGPQTIIDFKTDLGDANQKTALDVQYSKNTLNLLKAPVTGTVLNSAQIAAGVPQSQGTTSVLQKLEACIPGPDTGWDTRLQQYADSQLGATQARGNADNGNSVRNQQVYKLIQQQVKAAIQEEKERTSNPFLNIPAATEMRTIASDFYANSQHFQGIFSTLLIKRQVSQQLVTIIAQVKAFIPTLVLFDDQWQSMTQAQKDALYSQLSPQIAIDSAAGDFSSNYTTTDANGNVILTPLPPMQLTTTKPGTKIITNTIDNTAAHNDAEESRVLDEEWQVWETDTTHITEAQRQTLYGQFTAIQDSVTDANSLQTTQNTMNSVAQQNTDLADALHDCLLIRTATQNYTQYKTQADWDAFKNTLYSSTIQAAFLPNTSIIAVANGTAGIDFSKEGDISLPLDVNNDLPTAGGDLDKLAAWVLSDLPKPPGARGGGIQFSFNLGLVEPSQDNNAPDSYYLKYVSRQNNINQLQVQPVVPLTQDPVLNQQIGVPDVITGLFDEDSAGALFCRLQAYTLDYWIPSGMTGLPIGCFKAQVAEYNSTLPGDIGTTQGSTNQNWYHVNRAEIYYNLANPTLTQ